MNNIMDTKMKFNPALAFTPNVKKAQISVPNYKELSPNEWTHKLASDPYYYLLPADQQSKNYFNINEQYQNAGIKQYNQPTGNEPIYANMSYNQWRANLKMNNGELTKDGLEVLSDTRVTGPFVDAKFLMNPVSQYKIPDFLIDFKGGGENLLI